jgi:hypothetical protein
VISALGSGGRGRGNTFSELLLPLCVSFRIARQWIVVLVLRVWPKTRLLRRMR